MNTPNLRLGFLESIGQVLALKTENLTVEYPAICRLLKQADEGTFYRLAPHLFVVTDVREPIVVQAIEGNTRGYKLFKQLVEEGM
ncbi:MULTISPECIES: hypothetical protein [unclassified Streptococcus]|uniref:hypothetical protein n=1 Tax=unclassified Streptococcus TaxID=2608887 RepID=UPI0010727C94|nr:MULTISPECIES: hypothetical protein [unclassified Streptococcus]MBF0786669.1 hypothetical protein [Streptococcus sp. 19428wC2_LYSM12]MCQ9211708.1 hypothetical protein [Streptococcus sp. B01]MCQ9213103.1 hypothetical protein [Streptococcus sp. O1]TFV06421.1 hypothetical protein E4T79_01850 [Streptococcus sp. LYSM12]